MGKKNREKDRYLTDDRGRPYLLQGGNRYYSERSGGNAGRVQEDQFSIDGRAFDYRNPRNKREIEKANYGLEKGEILVNPQSSPRFNPLYDYDFGTVRDAAKELGIGNVNEKKEVRQILKYIQGERKKPESKLEKPKPKPEIKIPDSPYDRPTDQTPTQPGTGSSPAPGSIQYDPSSIRGKAFASALEKGGRMSQLDDALARVADFGNRARDDYFGRFLPEMEQRNINESEEMTRNTLIAIRDFVGTVPKPGDPKELFEYYRKKIS